MSAVPGTPVTSANPNTTTNTSLPVALGSTTIGTLNVIEISGLASGTMINPSMTTPPGWTKVLEQMDTNGTPASFVAIYYRIFQSGDPSSVTISWTNAGQMVAICTPWTGFDTSTPIPYSASDFKVLTDANYGIPFSGTLTTGTNPGILAYGFANRTGTAWTGTSDNARGSIGLASSATMIGRATASDVAASTAYSKTALGSNTSVGVSWAYTVKAGGSSLSGDAALTATATISAGASVAGVGANASLTGTATVTASANVARSASASLTVTATTSATSPTRVERWLAQSQFYCAHRGGSDDWPEMTMYAYGQSAAWNSNLALEVSAWRSSDGVWVASHDQTTGRVFGTNYDIPTTPWATMSGLTTTVGGYPIARLVDVLAAYGASRVIFADNKSGLNNSEFLDIIDTYCGPGGAVIKMFYTATSLATPARARGYKTWGYYYDADVGKAAPNLASTQSNYDIIGMDYLATSGSWTAAKSYGKPVMAHIVNGASAKTTALGFGSDGMMVSKVTTVVPQNTFAADATLTGTATLTASAGVTRTAATTTLTGTAALTGSAAVARTVAASTVTTATLAASASVTRAGAASSTSTATITADATVTSAGTVGAAFTGSAALTAAATVLKPTSGTASGTATITAGASISRPASSALVTVATITAAASVSTASSATAARTATATITASATVNPGGIVTPPPPSRTVYMVGGNRNRPIPPDARSVSA